MPGIMKLRDYRKSQTPPVPLIQLAEHIGVSASSLSRIESGEQWPSREVVLRIFEWSGGAVTANDFAGIEADAIASAD